MKKDGHKKADVTISVKVELCGLTEEDIAFLKGEAKKMLNTKNT